MNERQGFIDFIIMTACWVFLVFGVWFMITVFNVARESLEIKKRAGSSIKSTGDIYKTVPGMLVIPTQPIENKGKV